MAISGHSAMSSRNDEKLRALRAPDADGIFVARHVGPGIAASPSSISRAACSRCRRRKRGGQSPLIYTGEVYNFVELRDELKRLGPSLQDL